LCQIERDLPVLPTSPMSLFSSLDATLMRYKLSALAAGKSTKNRVAEAMPRSSQSATDDQANCDAPTKEFVAFAKGLAAPRAARRWQALAESPAAGRFAERLLTEAFSGAAHAATCMSLIGRFDSSCAAKFGASKLSGEPPSPNNLQPKELEPVGRGVLAILKEQALPWLAHAYIRLLPNSTCRPAVEKLLLDNSPTPHALCEAVTIALGRIETDGKPITKAIAARSIDALEKYASQLGASRLRPEVSPLARLAKVSTLADMGRLVDALLALQTASPVATGDNGPVEPTGVQGPTPPEDPIADAAWRQADGALARALQNIAALKHAVDEASELDAQVRGFAGAVSQAVRSAAAKRELELDGTIGATAQFDPLAHQADDPSVGSAALVRIRIPAVAQGRSTWRRVLKKAEVVPA
jgi:hypothetical protein